METTVVLVLLEHVLDAVLHEGSAHLAIHVLLEVLDHLLQSSEQIELCSAVPLLDHADDLEAGLGGHQPLHQSFLYVRRDVLGCTFHDRIEHACAFRCELCVLELLEPQHERGVVDDLDLGELLEVCLEVVEEYERCLLKTSVRQSTDEPVELGAMFHQTQ